MARYEYERSINASPDACYALFTDLDRVQEISSEVVEMSKTNDMGFEPGMTFTCTRQMMGKNHTESLEVETAEPGKSYSIGCESCGGKWVSSYVFTPEGSGTHVRMEMDCTPRSLLAKITMPITSLLFSGMVNKSINKELDELKAACEAG